jgi:hypothetical protein
MMTDQSIDDAARRMLTEMVVHHVHPDSDEWLDILAKRCPEATLTDRVYIAMRVAGIIAEWRRKAAQ